MRRPSSSSVRTAALKYSTSMTRTIAPMRAAIAASATISDFWGAIGSIGATAKSTIVNWPSGRLVPREARSEISSAIRFASRAASCGSVSWTRIDRNRVVSLAVTRLTARSSSEVSGTPTSLMADSSSGVVVTSSEYVWTRSPAAARVSRSVLYGPTSRRVSAS